MWVGVEAMRCDSLRALAQGLAQAIRPKLLHMGMAYSPSPVNPPLDPPEQVDVVNVKY